MAYIVTPACIGCKHSACVTVCPADCFHEGPNMLVINPDTCIDCGNCVPACPENAIVTSSKSPDPRYAALNKQLAARWPVITEQKDPLPDCAEAAKVTDPAARLKMLKLS